jgi:hypothetical protein
LYHPAKEIIFKRFPPRVPEETVTIPPKETAVDILSHSEKHFNIIHEIRGRGPRPPGGILYTPPLHWISRITAICACVFKKNHAPHKYDPTVVMYDGTPIRASLQQVLIYVLSDLSRNMEKVKEPF